MKTRTLTLLIALLFIAFAFEQARVAFESERVEKTELATLERRFAGLELEARAAYVYDVTKEKVLYAKNETLPLPLASLTKLMTGLVALEAATGDVVLSVDPEALRKEGDTGLYPGEKWELGNLVEFTLTTSSNDGAEAIAAGIAPFLEDETGKPRTFIEAMNAEAKALGLTSMVFFGSTGLDADEATAGGYGSARDVSFLMARFLERHPLALEPTAYGASDIASLERPHAAPNTNKQAAAIPGLLASKTGFTDLAGGNLSIAFEKAPGHIIIATVLGSSQEGRFADMERIVARVLGIE